MQEFHFKILFLQIYKFTYFSNEYVKEHEANCVKFSQFKFTRMLNSDTESVTFCKEKIPPLRRTDRLRFLSISGIVSSLLFVNNLPVFSISFYLSFSFRRKRRRTSNGFNSPWRAARLVLKGKEIFFGAWIVDQAVRLKSE